MYELWIIDAISLDAKYDEVILKHLNGNVNKMPKYKNYYENYGDAFQKLKNIWANLTENISTRVCEIIDWNYLTFELDLGPRKTINIKRYGKLIGKWEVIYLTEQEDN